MGDKADIDVLSSLRPVEAPDLISPVFAFRDWRVDAEGLRSPRTGTRWTTRVLEAVCHPRTADDFVRPPHRAPGRTCNCGIHSYYRPSLDTSKVDFTGVTGIVTVSGTVEVHETGVRAQRACVEALGVYGPWSRRQKYAVARVAGALGVDLVDVEDLSHLAHRYGTPMPPALIPRPGSAPILRRRVARPAPHRVVIVPVCPATPEPGAPRQ
jgi:hypothetical protein